ncbi:MAG TPA: FHA domain-containing protein [Solirubrobacterales bacterium]|nr:FHA domain-containing protein [Solirubrobacterales bacterium]
MSAETGGPQAVTGGELKAQLDAERAGRPFLVWRDGDGDHHVSPIDVSELWIGRAGSAGLSIDWDDSVSTLHARLAVVGDVCTLEDDGLSRNGSFVNGERIRGARRLRDGDMLRFGRTAVLFRAPAEASAERTAAAGDLVTAATVSPAQRRVLVALCRPFRDGAGFATPATNGDIAAELHLSVDAVKTHLRALFEKFALGDLPQNQKRAALAERAMQSGLITERDF